MLYASLLLVVVTFMACDGRYRKFKTSAEILKASDLLNSFSKQINFIPEQPVKIETDTVLSNGFQVKLNYYSKADFIDTNVSQAKNSLVQTQYSNFEAKVEILKNNVTINRSIINKFFFKGFDLSWFMEKSVLQYVWIDYETSTNKKVQLNTSFKIPETENYLDFSISIDDKGLVQIKQKNVLVKTI
ncbi:hypothetical protein [Tamlana sp. 2201CG12-4]|uniref:hypothetical protein n=1 Tax=Tamlana sp. 2201CG12-4 TaxID=3112582 RepID=UPI002DBAF07B|nr:hypothetical protein [Tamlana sp. 2201CG12-4]